MLKMNEMKSYSYDEAHAGYGDAEKVQPSTFFTRQDGAALKFFEASENQMFGNPGVGTGGFSWADYSLSANVHSANFAGVDASRVVPTWSWGSPGEDFFTAIGNNGHAVSRLNLIDAIPADGVFLDRVRNGYALVEDRNFWSIDNKVNNSAKECRPHESDDVTSKRPGKPSLNIQSKDQNQHNASADSAGFSSENFGVAHVAHEYMVSYEGGDFRG